MHGDDSYIRSSTLRRISLSQLVLARRLQSSNEAFASSLSSSIREAVFLPAPPHLPGLPATDATTPCRALNRRDASFRPQYITMAWWRRETCLWARTPIHHHARDVPYNHEAALRARCFSKSKPDSAQHKNDGNERPAGMSNLEWMRLQHHQRWKRRFEVDPYRALFGASEDMLNGKGLMNWKWVQRTFPKWMVDEMGLAGSENERTPQGQ